MMTKMARDLPKLSNWKQVFRYVFEKIIFWQKRKFGNRTALLVV